MLLRCPPYFLGSKCAYFAQKLPIVQGEVDPRKCVKIQHVRRVLQAKNGLTILLLQVYCAR